MEGMVKSESGGEDIESRGGQSPSEGTSECRVRKILFGKDGLLESSSKEGKESREGIKSDASL